MWGFEYERLDKLLSAATELNLQLRKNPKLCLDYLLVLKEIYRPLRPLVYDKIREEIDGNFKAYRVTARRLASDVDYYRTLNREDLITFPDKFYDELDDFYDRIIELRQVLGLGIPVTNRRPDKERLGRALGV